MAFPSKFVRSVLAVLHLFGLIACATPRPAQASPADDMDKLLAPIALYPDALLAQVLTASTSPEQVTEFHKWLGQQKATGSDLQQAAMDAKFDAAFASLALFPDVVKTLAENLDWTKEVGTAYLSSKDDVSASVQRLRTKAKDQGNLTTNEQQKVTTTTEGSTQTIIIEPANPQVVYVPVYDPQVVYVQPAPPAGSMLLAFGVGIAIGAAMSNSYYGWGAWGYGWHGGGVHYHTNVWVVPPHGHYHYGAPVHGYRPNNNVVAPRNTNVNINVDNSKNINTGNQINNSGKNNNDKRGDQGGRGGNNAGAGQNAAAKPGTNDVSPGRGGSGAQASPKNTSTSGSRGHSSASASNRSGSGSGAMGGYDSGSSARASSSRGRSSAGGGGGGGGRRR